MTLICQCEFCGRIRLDRAWTRADFVVADVIGCCPTCHAWREKQAVLRLNRETRRTERRAATGRLTAPIPTDPFEGFREEEK